ncbi:MAG TPA: NAD(P)-dependent oxidoreductase [Actinomycetota bacterium]|nr:NAD(P)-dependent oxidoreductase [Actinomycetota bacterium]
MADVGFVGLGVMGGRIAKRLLDAGHRVTGFNRTRSKAEWLIEAGMTWADSPRDVAAAAEITLSMVTDTRALRAIVGGPDGVIAGLGSGKLYVDMSTVSPAVSREIAARVAERGARMLDAPVSGSVATLEEGRLAIMVGGAAEDVQRVRPVLLSIGPKVTHVGGNGQAALLKIASNLNLAVQMLAFSEAVLLAERGGIRREIAVEALLSGVIASPMLKYRGPFVLREPEDAWFAVPMMQKDLVLAQEAGRELNVPLPTTAVANEFLTAARAMGMEKRDFAAVFEVLSRMAGIER